MTARTSRLNHRFLTTALVLLLMQWGTAHAVQAANENLITVSPNFSTVSEGTQKGINSQQILVVQNQQDYAELLSRVSLSGAIPQIDFSRRTLIAIFMGPQANGCSTTMKVPSVSQTRLGVYLRVVLEKADPATLCPAVMRDGSYVLIAVKKSSVPVSVFFRVNAR